MYRTSWSILAAALLLVGCTPPKEAAHLQQTFEKRKSYHKRLMKTEKVQLYEGNFTKVTLTATYLNRQGRAKEGEEDSFLNYINPLELFEKRDKKVNREDEKFIIGLYVDDDGIEEGETFNFDLTLNGKPPKSITPLAHSDPRLKDISFVADWSQFYLIKFPHVNAERFNIVFESAKYGKGTLNFAKKAKFFYTKKAF